MRHGPPLKEVLRELRRAPGRVDDADTAARRRERIVDRLLWLQDALPRRDARRRRWQGALLVAAALVGVALVAGALRVSDVSGTAARAEAPAGERVVVQSLQGLVEVSGAGAREVVGAAPRALAPDERLQTHPSAFARVGLPSGARVSVGEGTLVAARSQAAHGAEELRVTQGSVDVQVPKLAPGRGFLVRTPDAIVTVRGTRFRVVVSEAAKRWSTRVDVSEGVVTVESGGKTVELRAGDLWSSSPPPEPAAAAVPSGPPADVAGTGTGDVTASSSRRGALLPSTLAEENELLRQAMAAARANDHARAAALFDDFLVRHARSPLAENAAVERLRALSRLGDRARAARAARRYLARYPGGASAELAQRLVREAADAASTSNGPRE